MEGMGTRRNVRTNKGANKDREKERKRERAKEGNVDRDYQTLREEMANLTIVEDADSDK